MNTTEYDWYRPDFVEYNIAQEAVIPFCDEDMNLIVCFGTAVGKTVIAECAFGFHLANEGKVAYVSPYRSLCSEKFDKWSKDFYLKVGNVGIQTGDRRSTNQKLNEVSLSIMTSESFNSRTRSPQFWNSWLRELDCLVIDEAHTIGDPIRGGAVEASLMRFSKLNPNCRIILLSATMDNAMEVAKWIKMLNGKQTKCFVSDWRPNKVEVVEFPVDGWTEMIDQTVERAGISNKKTIVFVHSKRVGKTLVKKMKKAGIRTAFHNASTGRGVRDKIEKAFDSPNSGFNVLVSTSTLGAGVNIG